MGRKERRQAQRNKEKLRKQREKESLKLPLWRRLAKTLFSNLWALAVAALTLLGGYAIFRFQHLLSLQNFAKDGAAAKELRAQL